MDLEKTVVPKLIRLIDAFVHIVVLLIANLTFVGKANNNEKLGTRVICFSRVML